MLNSYKVLKYEHRGEYAANNFAESQRSWF